MLHNLSTWLTFPVTWPKRKHREATPAQTARHLDTGSRLSDQMISTWGRETTPDTRSRDRVHQRKVMNLHNNTHNLVWESTKAWDGEDMLAIQLILLQNTLAQVILYRSYCTGYTVQYILATTGPTGVDVFWRYLIRGTEEPTPRHKYLGANSSDFVQLSFDQSWI